MSRRVPTGAHVLAGAALAAATCKLLRTISRTKREFREYRAYRAPLRGVWTTIPCIVRAPPLGLHARVGGEATPFLPPVVLVHGYGVGTGYLVPLMAHLAEHVEVHAPDLPGHGSSDHDARPLRISELALALAEWMDAYPLRRAVVVGHSLGCQIAAEVGARRPELVSGLVLVGPTSDAAARTTARQVARGLMTSLFDRPSYVILAVLDYVRVGARVLAAEMRQMVAHPIEDVLPRVTAASRVVRGGRDRIVPQPWADAVARVAGAPAPVVIPGWGHAVHYDDPEGVARVVLDLAREVGRTGAA